MRGVNSTRTFSLIVVGLIIALPLVASAISPLTIASTQDSSISLDVPSEATVGESISIAGSVSPKERKGDYEAEITVRLYIDNRQIDAKTVTVRDGETTTVSFSHSFEEAGTHSITIEGEGSYGPWSYSESASTSIDIAERATEARKTARPNAPTATIPKSSSTSVTGAAFPLPDSMKDEVADIRSTAPTSLAPQAFVLATEENLYLVFTRTEPTTGLATVNGTLVKTSVTQANLEFGVIAASTVSFNTTGTPTTVHQVENNPDRYKRSLVQISATHQRVSTLTDPDRGQNITVPTTAGVLVEDDQPTANTISQFRQYTQTLQEDPSQARPLSLTAQEPYLNTVSFRNRFWAATETTVTGLVLTPGSKAREYVRTFAQGGVQTGEPLLYVVSEKSSPTTIDSITALNQRSDELEGDVVSFEANMYQRRISVQETVEHNTACGQNQVQVQSTCINIVQDVLAHGGIAFQTVPQSNADILPVIGLSARHQDSPRQTIKGRYRITGEVVSTSRVNDSLPDGVILIVYEMERVGDIDYDSLSVEAQTTIENQSKRMVSAFLPSVPINQSSTTTATTSSGRTGSGGQSGATIEHINPNSAKKISFEGDPAHGVRQIRITAQQPIENAQIHVQQLQSLPATVSPPPKTAIRLLNISVTTSDSAIRQATIRVTLPKSELPENGKPVVYRYNGGEWTALSTQITNESGSEVVLRAKSPGFSYFAVATERQNDIPLVSFISGNLVLLGKAAGLAAAVCLAVGLAAVMVLGVRAKPLVWSKNLSSSFNNKLNQLSKRQKLNILIGLLLIAGIVFISLRFTLLLSIAIIYIAWILFFDIWHDVEEPKEEDRDSTRNLAFTAQYNCTNCGFMWEEDVYEGVLVRQTGVREKGVIVNPSQGKEYKLDCPNCSTSDLVTIESRRPHDQQ